MKAVLDKDKQSQVGFMLSFKLSRSSSTYFDCAYIDLLVYICTFHIGNREL
jgi:hypothetical protein